MSHQRFGEATRPSSSATFQAPPPSTAGRTAQWKPATTERDPEAEAPKWRKAAQRLRLYGYTLTQDGTGMNFVTSPTGEKVWHCFGTLSVYAVLAGIEAERIRLAAQQEEGVDRG